MSATESTSPAITQCSPTLKEIVERDAVDDVFRARFLRRRKIASVIGFGASVSAIVAGSCLTLVGVHPAIAIPVIAGGVTATHIASRYVNEAFDTAIRYHNHTIARQSRGEPDVNPSDVYSAFLLDGSVTDQYTPVELHYARPIIVAPSLRKACEEVQRFRHYDLGFIDDVVVSDVTSNVTVDPLIGMMNDDPWQPSDPGVFYEGSFVLRRGEEQEQVRYSFGGIVPKWIRNLLGVAGKPASLLFEQKKSDGVTAPFRVVKVYS